MRKLGLPKNDIFFEKIDMCTKVDEQFQFFEVFEVFLKNWNWAESRNKAKFTRFWPPIYT